MYKLKREKTILNTIVKYQCIHDYHKYKVEDIKLSVIQIILIRIYN